MPGALFTWKVHTNWKCSLYFSFGDENQYQGDQSCHAGKSEYLFEWWWEKKNEDQIDEDQKNTQEEDYFPVRTQLTISYANEFQFLNKYKWYSLFFNVFSLFEFIAEY